MPIYIHVLLFFGAFIGFGLLNSILFITGILQSYDFGSYIIPGLVFIGLAFALYFPFRRSSALLHSFTIQLSVMFMVTGKLLLVSAAYLKFDDMWIISLSLGILSILTYFIYDNTLDRFLFPFLCLSSILINLLTEFKNDVPMFGYFVFLMAIVFMLHTLKYKASWLKPFEVSLILTACFACAIVSIDFYEYYSVQWAIPIITFNITVAIYLIALTLSCAGSAQMIQKLPIFFACVGFLILSFISNAGILWGIALLMMGYQYDRKSLITLGGVFLILFLITYYYDLTLTLDYKAYLLIASGIFLILIRSVMKYLKWDKL